MTPQKGNALTVGPQMDTSNAMNDQVNRKERKEACKITTKWVWIGRVSDGQGMGDDMRWWYHHLFKGLERKGGLDFTWLS